MDFDLLILYLLVIGLVITSIYTPQWPYIEDPQHINLTKTSYFHKRCSIGINFPCTTPAIKLSEFACIIFLCACPPARVFLEKHISLKPLSIEAMQLTIVFLDLDCIFLYLVVEDFECLVVFWYCYCKLNQVFWAKMALSELLNN